MAALAVETRIAAGAASTRADGGRLTRAQPRRGRADVWLCGPCAGAPGIGPLDAQVPLPERGSASVLQAWMMVFAGAPRVTERAGVVAQLGERAVAASVLRAVAQEAPADDEGGEAPRPGPLEEPAGERLVVRWEGPGLPLIPAAAVQLTAPWGTGAKRPTQQEARAPRRGGGHAGLALPHAAP